MMIATEVSTKKARWLPTFRTSSKIVSTPMTRDGTSGVLDLPCTLAMAGANGKPAVPAIVKIIRMPPACTARLHTVIAISESIRNTLPIGAQRRLDQVRQPGGAEFLGVNVRHRHLAEQDDQQAGYPGRDQRAQDPGRAFLRGSRVSSASDPAVSNPYITYALISPATRNAPK